MMRYLIATAALVALSGCELGPYAPDYGDATQNNVAVQSVQPAPPAAAQPVAANGTLAEAAQERYEKDHVKPPVSTMTSSVSLGGGSSSSGQ